MKLPRISFGKSYKALETEFAETKRQFNAKIQELSGSILSYQEYVSPYRGTKYNTYETAVAQAALMYEGTADWGVNQFGSLVQARSSFIMPRNFKLKMKSGGDEEFLFATNFMNFNDIPEENSHQFIIESEIEGKILLALSWDDKTPYIDDAKNVEQTGMVSVRFISQTSTPYVVNVDPKDYMLIKNAQYTIEGQTEKTTLPENRIVYRKFGGRINQPNKTTSRTLRCLTQIENLDKALRDLRELNHLFAVAIPDLTVETKEDAADARDALDRLNFKPGKAVVHTGKFAFVQPTMTGTDMLYKEIVVLAETISYNTGIPVHYWFPELATNRATADDISFGLVFSSTARERDIWRGLFEELIDKAIMLYNEKASKKLRQGMIEVEIPVVTKDDLDRLESFWLRALSEKAITHKTFLSKIPDIDVEEELEGIKTEADENFQRMKENGMFGMDNGEGDETGNKEADNARKEETNLQKAGKTRSEGGD